MLIKRNSLRDNCYDMHNHFANKNMFKDVRYLLAIIFE